MLLARHLLFILTTFFSVAALAFPVAPKNLNIEDPAYLTWPVDPSALFYTPTYDFNAIVKLNNCSGSLVAFYGQQYKDKALVLTNGHCLGNFIPPGKALVDEPSQRSMLVFNREGRRFPIRAERLVYATMTGTDLALYRLDSSYEQILQNYGILPLLVATTPPSTGLAIDIISGYWERGFRCLIEAEVPLLREDAWEFYRSLRYSEPGCDTYGGTSGSPVISRDTGELVAINNTGNQDGESCTMNNPCEVDEQGNVSVLPGASYGQQTYWLYSCLTADFRIDLQKPGCELTR